MINERVENIIEYIREHPGISSSEILSGMGLNVSPATLRRDLVRLAAENKLSVEGRNKGTRYFVSPTYDMFMPVDVEAYFKKEIDERNIIGGYNFELLSVLSDASLFTKDENKKLSCLQRQFQNNVDKLTPAQYKKEMERLAVDVSWKSSQIEGNTYSLLETDR
jgi:hypothetical protein